MPKQRIDNFEFWYGTPDAPAPSGNLSDDEPSLVVGTSSDIAAQAVAVRYRDMGERWQDLRQVSVDHKATGHFVRFQFPPLKLRARIEYEVLASVVGKEPQQIGPRQTFRVTAAGASVRASTPSKIIPVATARKLPPPKGEVRSEVALQPASGALARAAKVAGLSNEATHSLTSKAPDTSLFDDATARELVAEGAIEEAAADKLAVATIALNVTGGDEDAAGKVMTELARRGVTKPRDLAAMTSEEMTAAFELAGAASHDTAMERATHLRAAASNAFPSESVAPSRAPLPEFSIRSGAQPVVVKPEVIDAAWKKNAGLDLLRMDLSKDSEDRKKLNLTGFGPSERKAFFRDIQIRKGVVRATNSADVAEKLLKGGITSPAKVSPGRLAKEAEVSLGRAKTIRDRDIKHYGRLSHGLFTLLDAHSGGLQNLAVGNLRRAQVVDFVRRAETNETFDGLDNIQELFGNLDSCDCKHCNSILSPAAYFVDLMHFIQTHVLDEEVAEDESDAHAPFKGKQGHPLHLKNRRPDLWVLPLTCENTHMEIPQLQITTEIFENFIAKKRGIAVAPDRRAVVSAVYGNILPAGRHSVFQPFHLPLEELEIYLGHFKLRRGDIAELLDEPEEVQLLMTLGIAKVHADLIIFPDASPVNIHNKLGLTVPPDGILAMGKMLEATQLSRKDLGAILASTFVSSGQPLSIMAEKKSAESVQFDIERIHGVTLGHLDRVHRLLRLRRYLPWLPEELDGFIASVGGNLNPAALADAGRAVLLKRRFKATLHELCALSASLPNFSIERRKSPGDMVRTPFDALFNDPGLVRVDGSYPNPSLRYTTNDTSGTAQERSMRLRAGLGIDEGELVALIEGLGSAFQGGTLTGSTTSMPSLFEQRLRKLPLPGLPPSILPKPARLLPPSSGTVSFPLNDLNLSLLVRHAVLGRWLKLSMTDLLTVIRLTPGVGAHIANLRQALALVRFYDWWKSTPLSLEAFTLLLAPTEALRELVEDLAEAVRGWLKEQDQVALTDTFLTQLDGVSEELSQKLVALNMGKVFEAAGDRFRVIASSQDTDFDLTPLQSTQVDVDAVRKLVRGYHPSERLPRALTEALKVDIDLARDILAAVLGGQGSLKVEDFLQEGPPSEAVKLALAAIMRLHGIGSALRLSSASLRFVIKHQSSFGFSNWADPNYEALRRIVATQAFLKQAFRNDPAPAFAQIERALTDRATLPDVAVALFGLEATFARDLVAKLRIPANAIDALLRMEQYATTANKLSIDATTLLGIVSEDYTRTSMASAAVIAGFRAKYSDEATWKEKVEPYQERVLEKKRDALIDYLLRGPDASFPTTSEMYKYFLIDGEVDGCFRTSRVVAANSSLQLYVHRIRMNLEKEPNDGLNILPSLIPDVEWEWRKHYRVWEANRKIFLWPENYLDPTIRDDKTPLFKELESELLQQQITEQTVIDAYSNYLKGLEELANLRYAGAYHHYTDDEDAVEGTDIIYLFGATGGEAPTHYWREIRNLARSQSDELVSPEYGPWQKVKTRIPVRPVSPVVYEGQLHVFWNEITTTSNNIIDDGRSFFVGYSHRYTLKFSSLRLDGEWTQPESLSLKGTAPTFRETDSTIDDPLAEVSELPDYIKAVIAKIMQGFGIYQDPSFSPDKAVEAYFEPRWGEGTHSKAREGYTLDGPIWERPYVSLDPTYSQGLVVNCAGLLVRGVVDLFERRVLPMDGNKTCHKTSPKVNGPLFAHKCQPSGDITYLKRQGSSFFRIKLNDPLFDYPVAATLMLNWPMLISIFNRHWGKVTFEEGSAHVLGGKFGEENIAGTGSTITGAWVVAGTTNETIIETDSELVLLQPSPTVPGGYVSHRLDTTLVKGIARKLFSEGIKGLLATTHQLSLDEPAPTVRGTLVEDRSVQNPIANDASYAIYYQEIFQHIPLLIAHHLNAHGESEQAQRWYHYVFDPTSPEPQTDPKAPETDRNWKYRQFRGQEQAKLRDVLSDTTAIQKYREDPFNAHAIARLRVSAYQKSVVMGYIDNLLDWADERFTRFQMETVNEAMMLYVTAAEVLGQRPVQLGECGELSDGSRTYARLKDSLSRDGDFLLEVEQLIPQSPLIAPPAMQVGFIHPAWGLAGLLAFQPTKTSAAIGATPLKKSEVVQPTASMFEAAPFGGRVKIGAGEAKTASRTAPMSEAARPITTRLAMMTSNFGKVVDQPGTTEVRAARKGSSAAKVSRERIGVLVDEVASREESSGVASGPMINAVPFAKIAFAQPFTEPLVRSFLLQQQFQFLGDHWKLNGGRHISPTLGDRFGRAVVRQISAAFCIPRNETLEAYWDRVEDRIQKIRTCRDITGRKRKLSLFAPALDPALLARARASGIALDDAIGAFEGMIPQHRFPYLLQKAKEFAGTVQSFGAALQSALERKDAEELVRLQIGQQQQILSLTTKAKEWELESATANLEATERRKTAVENRRMHYAGLLDAGLNEWEVAQSIATHTASIIRGGSSVSYFVAGALGLIPQIGSPFAMKYGGTELKEFPHNFAAGMNMLAEVATQVATSAALEAGHDRRREDWGFQRDQSVDELSQIDKQIEAGGIARSLAEHAIKIHEKNLAHNDELLEYHEDKFSNLGLYTWIASNLQRTYREAYNMAYRMARYAEQAYRFEREDYSSEMLSGQYWEANRAGLLAGNRLALDLQYLEQRYIETDLPKREISDHVFSLRQWDPKALIELRQKGECKFKVPELFFDLASPGDYRRRLRSVRVTLPAVAGPYVNVMATLSMNSSQMRYEMSPDLQDAPRPRVDSITTSSARNDAGAFELNFRGEKYMPFEGAGAVSEWSLSLPTVVRMFDYNTISDVILHLDYTALFDGLHRDVVQGVTSGIVASVKDRLAGDGIARVFSTKEEFPVQHHRLVTGETVEIEITQDHLPFFLRSATVKEASMVFTGMSDDAPGIGDVVLNEKSLGAPTEDEGVDGVRIPLAISGDGPWKLKIRVTGMPAETRTYLLFRFAAS